jgi:hypothetical protein
MGLGTALAHRGEEDSARAAATQHSKLAPSLTLTCRVTGYSALAHTALAAGDTDNRELISSASTDTTTRWPRPLRTTHRPPAPAPWVAC